MPTYVWMIRWSNPFTKPPDGKPEELLRVQREASSGADMPPEIANFPTIGTGYAIHSYCLDTFLPKRTLSEETKQKIRRANLKRRLEKRLPLFAEELYEKELRAKPDYYGLT